MCLITRSMLLRPLGYRPRGIGVVHVRLYNCNNDVLGLQRGLSALAGE